MLTVSDGRFRARRRRATTMVTRARAPGSSASAARRKLRPICIRARTKTQSKARSETMESCGQAANWLHLPRFEALLVCSQEQPLAGKTANAAHGTTTNRHQMTKRSFATSSGSISATSTHTGKPSKPEGNRRLRAAVQQRERGLGERAVAEQRQAERRGHEGRSRRRAEGVPAARAQAARA